MSNLKEKLIIDYNKHVAVKDIVKKYNISRPTVYNYLKEHGITPNRHVNRISTSDEDIIPREMKVKNYLDELEYSYVYNRASADDKNVCGKYRPDFLFKGENHFVIIEVDENEHSYYEAKCEVTRMLNITFGLGLHTIFLRFNPDRNYGDKKNKTIITDEILDSRLYTLGNRLDACLALEISDLESMPLMTVEYLFYSDQRINKLKTVEESDLKDEFKNEHLNITDIVKDDELCKIKNKFVCNFCGSSLSSKFNLATHQKNTIKCLEIQYNGAKTTREIKNEQKFKCDYCEEKFTQKIGLQRHIAICRNKDSFEKFRDLQIQFDKLDIDLKLANQAIQHKDETISKLEEQLLQERKNQQTAMLTAISKPTTSVKNTVKNCVLQNLIPLIESEMRDQAKYLTTEHIKAGPEGYAKYAIEHALKDKYTCTDMSRRKLAFKNDQGEIEYDEEGCKIASKVFWSIKAENLKLIREKLNELGEDLQDAYNRDDQTAADAIVDITDKLCTWRREALEASNGRGGDFKNDFVKRLCTAAKSS